MSIPLYAPDSLPKFRVAICGGGVGGLILAITIGKYDPSIPIDLYEAHESIGIEGAGITLWWQTHEVLKALGLLDELKQMFTGVAENGRLEQYMRRSDIPEGGYLWYLRVSNRAPTPLHRQHMMTTLEKHLPASCTVHLKKRLVAYTEPERQNAESTTPIILEFTDGTTATTDVLVGADGIRSAVRKTLFEAAAPEDNGDDKADLRQYIEASFTGITIYRSLISAERLRQEAPSNRSLTEITTYVGKGRSLVTYQVAKGAVINAVALICDPKLMGTRYEGHWVTEATCDEFVGHFDNFEPDARTLIKLSENPSKWALHVVKPLPFYVRKRVALIGDAAHAMTPHFGAGAGQAIYDAFVLGRLIAHPLTSFSRVPSALRIYEAVRLPFAHDLARSSLSLAFIMPFMAPGYYDGTRKVDDLDENGIGAYEREGMDTLKQEIFGRWHSVETMRGPLEEWTEAESRLQASAD